MFAKKVITKATQFGPLEGIYQTLGNIQENEFNLKIQDKEGYTYRLDISDESKYKESINYLLVLNIIFCRHL